MRKMMMFLTVAVLMMALVGCGRPSEPNSGNSDVVFEIAYTPKSGATVFPDTVIQITPTIGVSIDCASLHTGVVFNPVLTGNWMCDEDVATFHSFYSLPEGVQNVSVKTSVRGTNGEVLGHAVEWSFNVSASVPSGNNAPRIVYQGVNKTVFPGDTYSWFVNGMDADGQFLTYTCSVLNSPTPVVPNIMLVGSTGATVSLTTAVGVNGFYRLACKASDGMSSSNTIWLETVARTVNYVATAVYLQSDALVVQPGTTASATFTWGSDILKVVSLGGKRYDIQLFYRPFSVVGGEIYAFTMFCDGGGSVDTVVQESTPPYKHYDENRAVACDGSRTLYFRVGVADTDMNARLSVMPRDSGEKSFGILSVERVL